MDDHRIVLTVDGNATISGDITLSQLRRIRELLNHFIESNILFDKEIKGKL